jgi:hypothetical protein
MDLISLQAVIVNDPQFFQNICDFIVGGGTLVEFCAQKNHGVEISYPACLRWIRLDPTRRELYDRALKDREEWQIDKILREIQDIGTFNLGDIFEEDGTQKKFKDWPSKIQRAVKEINNGKDGTEIKFFDKLKALEMLGKQAGMFKEKVEHSGKVTLEHLVSQSKPGPPPKKDKQNERHEKVPPVRSIKE